MAKTIRITISDTDLDGVVHTVSAETTLSEVNNLHKSTKANGIMQLLYKLDSELDNVTSNWEPIMIPNEINNA